MFDVHTHFIPSDVLLWLKENKAQTNSHWPPKNSQKANVEKFYKSS